MTEGETRKLRFKIFEHPEDGIAVAIVDNRDKPLKDGERVCSFLFTIRKDGMLHLVKGLSKELGLCIGQEGMLVVGEPE